MIKVKNLMISEFERRIQTEKVICFCAGQGLLDICERYSLLSSQIIYVVDNYKYGQKVEIQNHLIPIVSMDEIQSIKNNSMLIISSIQYAKQIVKQLDEVKSFDGLEVYIPAIFIDDVVETEIKVRNKSCIPKKIHYCWFGNNEIPEQFKKNIESWKQFCPDYEIIRWDESNYDVSKCSYMRQAYEAKKWGFVPDYARLDIVNTYGGIYLDTDVELIKPLDELLKYDLFCGFESLKYVAFGLGFGAKANHSLLQEMMQVYDETDFLDEKGILNITASPIYQTNVLLKHGLIQNGRTQKHEKYIVFSKEFFAPFNPYGYGYITNNTYSIHQYAATWFDERQKREKEKIEECYRFIMERIEK